MGASKDSVVPTEQPGTSTCRDAEGDVQGGPTDDDLQKRDLACVDTGRPLTRSSPSGYHVETEQPIELKKLHRNVKSK